MRGPLFGPQLKQRTHRDPHSNVHAQRAERVMCKVKQVPETQNTIQIRQLRNKVKCQQE